MKRIVAVLLVCAGLVSSASCNDTPTSPGGGQTVVTSVTLVFVGTVAPGESPNSPFTLPSGLPVAVTLASLTDSTTGVPLPSANVTLKFGVPTTNSGCDPLSSVTGATPRLTTHVKVLASAGQYCVGLLNTEGLPVSANYAIRVVYGTFTETEGPGTLTWASSVLPSGSTSRSFNASADGTITIGIDTISPNVPLGVGLGIPKNDNSGCEMTTSLTATPGTQFTASVDAGKYCVKVFDPGTLTDSVAFQMRIIRP
jgi:hypothetical protein